MKVYVLVNLSSPEAATNCVTVSFSCSKPLWLSPSLPRPRRATIPALLLTQSLTRSLSAAAPTATETQPQAPQPTAEGPWRRTAPRPHRALPAAGRRRLAAKGRTKAGKKRTRIKTRRGRTLWPTSSAVLARTWAAS